MLTVTHNLLELEKRLERASRGLSTAGIDDAMADWGERLVKQQRDAFDDGGHESRGGPRWEPTDWWWVDHMSGKHNAHPLVWTGRARDSVRMTQPRGGHMELRAVDYIGKFQFGPFDEAQEIPVVFSMRNEDEWEAVPDASTAQWFESRAIKRRKREVFWIGPHDADWLVGRVSREMGLDVSVSTAGFAEF